MAELSVQYRGMRERWRALTDNESIAAGLLKDDVITQDEYDVWYDLTHAKYGDNKGFELNRKYEVGTRRLQQVAADVRILISNRRIALFLRIKDRSGKTVASGSHTRHASDVTGDMRERNEWSWQTERMKVFGKLDRWSRKR